eukprot:6194236-Pleurochrysis_carterae.AAC.3
MQLPFSYVSEYLPESDFSSESFDLQQVRDALVGKHDLVLGDGHELLRAEDVVLRAPSRARNAGTGKR